MSQPEKQFILIPFMAQGHFIPFIALANLLQDRTNYKVNLVSTPLNIQKLQSSLPPDTKIQLKSLPFSSSDHNLPPNCESTDAVPAHLITNFYESSQSLQPSFEKLVSEISQEAGNSGVCIIADMFLGWTVEVAQKLGVFHSVFVTCGAYGAAVYFSLWLHLPHRYTDSDQFLLPDFPEALQIHRTQLAGQLIAADGKDPWSKFRQRQLPLSLKTDGFLFNTVEELEKIGLRYFSRKTNRPTWAFGPVTYQGAARKEPGVSVDDCVKWLNLRHPGSVLYIAFGSQNSISASQMMKLAMGLELSGKPFIWAIRPPVGLDGGSDFRDEWLPEGFETRITEKGLGILVRKWAPQLEILSHPSTGAFLSHCGWNSTVESLIRGVPIIAWPITGEQFYNSKLMEEEMGVCVEIARGLFSEIGQEEIAKVIEMVMGETQKGEEMRRKVCQVKKMVEEAVRDDEGIKGSSVKALDEFICTAFSVKRNQP